MKQLFPLAGLALLIGGCVSPDTSRYPSLLPRPIESRSDAEPVVTPPALAAADPATESKLAAFRTTLGDTDMAFAAAADRAEAAARLAKGDAVGSDRWITAQTALAELDGHRATLSGAVTDIEQMAIERAAAGEAEYPGLEALRGAVQTALDAESARIATIQAMLPAG
ncbi:hypothetical protein QH494_03270 [Sphingomonas sp. AR_OL41]|uniref:hypothetical protein n=1 Tax=Sphingomonas sp. AR_OL41 TaxID=3042729 RepID=UPI0024811486|nr:hypothetical protein [Sphingomonas sp. AR_OL41]MDH7971191.1 hypothetical protein [Sphingomonas sp. AR_OL41]